MNDLKHLAQRLAAERKTDASTQLAKLASVAVQQTVQQELTNRRARAKGESK